MKAIKKDSIIQIKYTLKRFCSILLMALLGVGFFAGIKATSPDMENTLDSYFDENNVFDIQLVSTLGFTKKDIEAVEKIDGIESMYPTYSTDLEFEISEKNIIVKAFAYTENEINQFVLLEGNLPTEQGQCVVEEEFIQSSDLNIGDKITTKLEEDSILKEYTFEIVGIIQSPLFISRERGSSKLGDGIIDCYLYISQQSFEQDIYTECYINIEETKQLNTFTQKYTDVIEEKKRLLEEVAKIREEERYQEILDEANAEIAENEKKLLDAKEEAERKLQEAESKIQSGEKQIVSAENAIYNNEITAQMEFEDANAKIEEAQKTLQEKETQWADAKINLLEQISEGEDGIENIKNGIQTIEQVIIQIEEQYEGITDEELLKQKEEQIQKLTLEKTELEKQQKEIQSKLEIARQTITQTEEQLEQGKSEIENNKQELEKTKKTTYSRINEAKATIATQKKELEEAKMTLTEEREKAEKEIKEAEEKIISAKKDLEKLEKPTWYVLDRTSNIGYYSYKQDTQRIANIGKIFPIVFFIVATLISLTSMTRMVEEQRVQIGTLKALGYSNLQIAWKYIIYASAATIIGSVIGMSIGFILLPKIIFSMYQMMYTMPDIQLNFNWYYAVLGLAIASLCIVGATIYACYMELKNTPAELMRPRAPKPGKRVILEKIPFIWKNMNFTKKVTARNLFRYKKRFLMTIIGICGCTALILAGFGLKNSIGSMIPMQYEKIFKYQMSISLKDITEEEKNEKEKELQNMEDIEDVLNITMEAGSVKAEKEENVQIIIADDTKKIQEFIQLQNRRNKQTYMINPQEVIITEKLAKLLNLKEGDTITLRNTEEKESKVKISAITENYVYHYVYISSQLYKEIYETEPKQNVILVKTADITKQEEDELAKTILEDDSKIAGVSKTSTDMSMLDDTMKSLDSVIWILIISAGLLALVVLYNLSNVNISERIRELATIKVLGFYDREVYDYVTRETIILTLIGIIIGLAGGYFLNLFIIETCELDIIMFNKTIEPISYLYAVLITGAFAGIVNFATYFQLKKIDMIESLKSVE